MRKSTNFNLNLVEGNDLVNPLVQDVPNYEAIDEQMYKNECNSVGIATELKSGTVHALTRTIPNASMFRFKATSNFTSGDTFTVDGIQVSALTPNGETLASNSYIIGSEVLCVLRETLLTVYVSGGIVTMAQDSEKLGGHLPEYYGTAENVSTALTTAQSANQLTLNLQQAVNDINSNLTADGTPFRFGKDAEGNFGYIITDGSGADSVVPFSNSNGYQVLYAMNSQSVSADIDHDTEIILTAGGSNGINYLYGVKPNGEEVSLTYPQIVVANTIVTIEFDSSLYKGVRLYARQVASGSCIATAFWK